MKPLIPSSDPGGSTPWGPAAVDPAVASSPATPAAEAATQSTQVSNEAQRTALAVPQLPPPPLVAPIVDESGRVTRAWVSWLQLVYRRVGGATSSPSDDAQLLAFDPGADVSVIRKEVDSHTDPWCGI